MGVELFNRANDVVPDRVYFCSMYCREFLDDMQLWRRCPCCNRYVRDRNPDKVSEVQWRNLGEYAEDNQYEEMCIKCYEQVVLDQGQSVLHLFVADYETAAASVGDVLRLVTAAAAKGRPITPKILLDTESSSRDNIVDAGYLLHTFTVSLDECQYVTDPTLSWSLLNVLLDPNWDTWFLRGFYRERCARLYVRPRTFLREARASAFTFMCVVVRLNKENTVFHVDVARNIIVRYLLDSCNDHVWVGAFLHNNPNVKRIRPY